MRAGAKAPAFFVPCARLLMREGLRSSERDALPAEGRRILP